MNTHTRIPTPTYDPGASVRCFIMQWPGSGSPTGRVFIGTWSACRRERARIEGTGVRVAITGNYPSSRAMKLDRPDHADHA